jgi:hypothetical protein
MKIVKILMIAFALSASLVACKKDDKVDVKLPDFKVEGAYEGKLGSGISIPNGFFGIRLKTGGVIERFNDSKEVTGTGTWKLEGDRLSASYEGTNGVKVFLDAELDKILGRFSGTWSNTAGNSGKWYASQKAN